MSGHGPAEAEWELPEPILVTPAMIEAGIDAKYSDDSHFALDEMLVESIYRAMRALEPKIGEKAEGK